MPRFCSFLYRCVWILRPAKLQQDKTARNPADGRPREHEPGGRQNNPALWAAAKPVFVSAPICAWMSCEARVVTLLVHIKRPVATSVSTRFAP